MTDRLIPSGVHQSTPAFIALADGEQVVQDDTIIDSTATAIVNFILAEDGSGLTYKIQLNGLALKEDPLSRTADNDVTKIHFHIGAPGTNGGHTLNIFGRPSEDDDDLVVDYENGIITGLWEDSDARDLNGDGDTDDGPESKPLSDFLEALKAGELYIQVHDVASDKLGTPGAVRGQITPLKSENSFTLLAEGEKVVQDTAIPDATATATATFTPLKGGELLAYQIEFDGLDLKEVPASRTADNDVTKIHVHQGGEGQNGPHALNIFGKPSEDDNNLLVDYGSNVITGVWGDDDATDLNGDGDTDDGPETKPLSQLIDELEVRQLYLQIHDVAADKLGTPGTIRGQLDTSVTEPKASSQEIFVAIANGPQVVQDPTITDGTGTAKITFILAEDGSGLAYQIKLNGFTLKADPAARTEDHDVTKIHIHAGERGANGPHTLNIFGLPSEDDNNLVVDYENGIITGMWDNNDATDLNGDGDTNDGPETKPLSQFIQALRAGDLYIQIHDAAADRLGTPGSARGQITPIDSFDKGMIKAVGDDHDVSDLRGDGDTSDPNETQPLSQPIDELEAGDLDRQIHDVVADQLGTPDTIRGQIEQPLKANIFTLVADGAQVVQDAVIPDSTARATATFILAEDGSGLAYQIKLDGIALKQNITDRTELNDVTRIHLHVGPEGENGPHTLNIFGLPSEDDDNLVVDFENGIITGIWNDSDATDLNGDGDTNDGPETKPLSEFIDELQSGKLYIQIHTVESDKLGTPGAIRGQVTPLFDSDKRLLTTPPTETLIGTDAGDTIVGGPGNQRIRGKGGNDTLRGGPGNDRILGDDGHDILKGGTGDDTLKGGDGNDELEGSTGNDLLNGEAGNDKLFGGQDNDALKGGNGDDILKGGMGDDYISGNNGDDFLQGGIGDDTLKGGSGNDDLDGGVGDDSLKGEAGDDKLFGGQGDDTLKGGSGNDVVKGGMGNDHLSGNVGHDIIQGGIGNDILKGGEGNDVLLGSSGNDVLDGGAGDDQLSGGKGYDTFILMIGGGIDTITDFAVDIDRIGLSSGLSFNQLTLSGNDIIAGNEVLATLKGVATEELTENSFTNL
ncbi:CHRD domain-containing protein [Adonisia turfae]|uniref:CHRD domain-containing protein n=1 Tax=Adonisia turfae CCMR0081 TaxID=2292702 RepID=A0A6M0RP24_9CYAN|nr:CHRD domain-containing protein [Adonisia turfae]NEZ57984.1 CHRD domain-containing protein [Adonisia turfae CCMR0081]